MEGASKQPGEGEAVRGKPGRAASTSRWRSSCTGVSCRARGMGEQENNKTGGGNNAMAVVDEAPAAAAAAKEKGRAAADPRLQGISDAIRVVPHFPKPGPPIPSRTQSFRLTRQENRTRAARGRASIGRCHGARPPGDTSAHRLFPGRCRRACMQGSCSTTSRSCCSGRPCSRTPWTCSSSATAAWASRPSQVKNPNRKSATTKAESSLLHHGS